MSFAGVFLIFCIASLGGISEGADNVNHMMSQMKVIKDRIFKDYDKLIRPLYGNENTTNITFNMYPKHIVDLDEERMLLTLESFFVVSWADERLKWNSSEYNGVMQLPADLLWKPDVTVYNSHGETLDPTHNVMLVLFSSGHVAWFPTATTVTTCNASFVQDVITCEVEIGSWTHDGIEMDMHLYEHSEYFAETFVNLHYRWELLLDKVQTHRKVMFYECCEEPYVSFILILPIKRRPIPELSIVRPPCALIAILTLAIFWMPTSECGKRIIFASLLFIVLNILTAYLATTAKSLQSVSPAMSLLRNTMFMLTSVIILQVFLLRLSRATCANRPPDLLVKFLGGNISKYLFLGNTSTLNISGDMAKLSEDVEGAESMPTPKDEWMLVATFFDRVLFLVYAVIVIFIQSF